MAYEDIVVEPQDGWVEIAINRPEKRNAMRMQTAGDLRAALVAAETDKAVHAVILKSTERGFCAGVDTSDFSTDPDSYYDSLRSDRHDLPLTRLFQMLPDYTKPIISAIEGYALGGGFEMALHGDIIIVDEETKLGLPEAGLGIIPGGGGTQTLSRLIGKNLTKELIWTGRFLEGAEILALGIANHLTAPGETLAKAREIAAAIATKAPLPVMFSKLAINKGSDMTLADGLALENQYSFALNFSADREEGLKAFAEKRAPKFKGA